MNQALQNGMIEHRLEKIFSSESFAGSARVMRILRFIVEQTVAGKASGINEYEIGNDSIGIELPKAYVPLIHLQARP